MAVVLFRKQEELSLAEAKQLLTQPDLTKASYVPPVKTKTGEVYLFSPGENPAKHGKFLLLCSG